ncbi:MAG: 3-hydroxyacyl-ACP dehydratase FabZ family protein [Bacteroidales bacterium]
MNREDIKKILPHREPMLLVDEMIIDENNVVHGKYTIKKDEFFLQGHFPGHPIVPGVILCEIMGQCSSMLVSRELNGRTPFYTGIDKTRFKNPVHVGDVVEVTAKIVMHKAMIFFIDAEASVRGTLCVSSRLSFALVENDKMNDM